MLANRRRSGERDFMSTPLGDNLKERIGNTPLLRFDRLTSKLDGVQVLAKAEWANPGGSVKDRAASNIVSDGLRNSGYSLYAV
jgi:cysteine synthase B